MLTWKITPKEMQGDIVIPMEHREITAFMIIQQIHEAPGTQSRLQGVAQMAFTLTLASLWGISAPGTSSLGHIPPPGVPENTCMAAHPSEGIGLPGGMRIKTGTKRSNLDLTSEGQLKFNI